MKLDKTKKYRVGEVVFEWVKEEYEMRGGVAWWGKNYGLWFDDCLLIALGAVEVENSKCEKHDHEWIIQAKSGKKVYYECEWCDAEMQELRGNNENKNI